MPTEITMPQLSDTMAEGTVVKWAKKEGDKIQQGEIIAEVETDKATMEMEAFESGTLAKILAKEGSKVSVGQPIAVLATGKETVEEARKKYGGGKPAPAAQPQAAAPAAKSAGQSGQPAPRGAVATMEEASRGEIHEPDGVGHGATREPPTAVPPVPQRQGNGSERVRISPLARKIAADKGIDPRQIHGSGPGGRIVQRDVADLVSAPPASAAPAASTSPAARVATGQKEVVPLSKMRLAIAKNLLASKQNVPHFYEAVDVDVEDLSKLRVRMNELLEPEKVRLSLGDFLAKAIATALTRHPALNATFNGTESTRYGDVNLGMAVAITDGLIVPVLRNINQMGLKEIRLRSMDLVERARNQRLKQDEMRGATFTVSNLGTYGVKEFSAIINPPEVGILAVAAAEKRAVVRGDAIVARTMMTLTLSADHRVVDGATAAEFLRTLKGLLEEPGMMLV